MGISIGCKIELVPTEDISRQVQNKRVYVSKVFDMMEPNLLQIAMPIIDGRIVPLAVGSTYSACFFSDKGLFECKVGVYSRYKSGNIYFLEISMLSKPTKVQRRQFFRLECSIDAKIRIMSDEEYENGIVDEEYEWTDAKFVDISGGGVRLLQHDVMESNEIIVLRFDLPVDEEPVSMQLAGRVIRSMRFKDRPDVYDHRIEFIKISPEDRDKIVKYIFDCQRMMRAKESGYI